MELLTGFTVLILSHVLCIYYIGLLVNRVQMTRKCSGIDYKFSGLDGLNIASCLLSVFGEIVTISDITGSYLIVSEEFICEHQGLINLFSVTSYASSIFFAQRFISKYENNHKRYLLVFIISIAAVILTGVDCISQIVQYKIIKEQQEKISSIVNLNKNLINSKKETKECKLKTKEDEFSQWFPILKSFMPLLLQFIYLYYLYFYLLPYWLKQFKKNSTLNIFYRAVYRLMKILALIIIILGAINMETSNFSKIFDDYNELKISIEAVGFFINAIYHLLITFVQTALLFTKQSSRKNLFKMNSENSDILKHHEALVEEEFLALNKQSIFL